MKNIGLFANSLSARTLIYNMDYVFNIPINNIYLLGENHQEDEILFASKDININILKSYNEFIDKSDVLVVAKDQIIPELLCNKETLIIDSPWKTNDDFVTDISVINNYNFSKSPVIVVLSLGDYTDQYHVEILVNKILSEISNNILQIFSPDTEKIITELTYINKINPNLCKKQSANNNTYDLLIISLKGLKNDPSVIQIMRQISPDFLILCVDYSFNKQTEIEHYFKYICNIDVIVKSPYITNELMEGKICSVYCGYDEIDTYKNTTDVDFESYLRKQIMQKIYMPTTARII